MCVEGGEALFLKLFLENREKVAHLTALKYYRYVEMMLLNWGFKMCVCGGGGGFILKTVS